MLGICPDSQPSPPPWGSSVHPGALPRPQAPASTLSPMQGRRVLGWWPLPGGNEGVAVRRLAQGVAALRQAAVQQQLLLGEDGQEVPGASAGELQEDGVRATSSVVTWRGRGHRGTCSVSQPTCLMSRPATVPAPTSCARSSSFTRGSSRAALAWMALSHDSAVASSFALRKRATRPSAEHTSRYLQGHSAAGSPPALGTPGHRGGIARPRQHVLTCAPGRSGGTCETHSTSSEARSCPPGAPEGAGGGMTASAGPQVRGPS